MAYQAYRPVDEKSSQDNFKDHDLPEAIDPQSDTTKEIYRPDHLSPEVAPAESIPEVSAYYAPHSHDAERFAAPKADTGRSRVCGLSRKVFFIVLGAILLLLVLAVGLGAGLGISLSHKSKSTTTKATTVSNGTAVTGNNATSSPLKVLKDTGMASTTRGDNAGMLVYYQLPNNSVAEEFHNNSDLTASSLKAPVGTNRQIIKPGNFGQQSPMSAISYTYQGNLWKHLFYVDNSGYVRMTNNSGATPDNWVQGDVLSSVPVKSGSMALTSCYSDDGGNDLHVLFGNSDGAIVEYYYSFNATGWTHGSTMSSGTSTSGAACGVYRQNGVKRLILYMRNATSNTLVHQVRQVDPVDVWIFVTESTINKDATMAIASDTGMALASNSDDSDIYLFYRGKDGNMKQLNLPAEANAPVTTYNSWDTQIPAGTQIAADWPDTSTEGPVVLYQSNEQQIQSSLVNWNAVILANGTLGESL